ncbi:MAG TPA: thioesterase family protein [Candidatus Limnocylindrales bacterium]|nr:thioesterase family protein [Candidatus Limnocylindrales bacterium]
MLNYHDVTVRVRYAETDQMGVVYHSNYLIWFEVGRVEIMRSLGFDYKQMEIEDDTFMVVADAHCRYHHPARYDELLIVRTRILEAKNRTLKFGYELFRQSDHKLLAHGHTIHVACSRAGQVKQFPEKYKAGFRSLVPPRTHEGSAA